MGCRLGAQCPAVEGDVVREPQNLSLLIWTIWLVGNRESPASGTEGSCVCSAALQNGATVWALVGACPAALLEEGDSHPAKFPLKIHPCRRLSAACDGNTRKDFFTCNSKTVSILGNVGRASCRGEPLPALCPLFSRSLPLMWSWVLALQPSSLLFILSRTHQFSVSFSMFFLDLSD